MFANLSHPQENKAGYTYADVVAMETSFWARSPQGDSTSTKDTGRLAKSCLKTGQQCTASVSVRVGGGWGSRSIREEGGAVGGSSLYISACWSVLAVCIHTVL